MNWLNKLRQKGWYWDIMCFIWCALLFLTFIFLTVPDIKGQSNNNYYELKTKHMAPGIVGLSAMPVSLTAVSLRGLQWENSYGGYDAYMQGAKLSSYQELQKGNEQILITGAIITGIGIGIQLLVNHKLKNRKQQRSYSCIRFP